MKRKTQKPPQVETEEQNTPSNEEMLEDSWLEELRGALSPHWSSRLEYQTHKRKGSDQ